MTEEEPPLKQQVFVVHPDVKDKNIASRDSISRLEETVGLASAIDVDVVLHEVVKVRKIVAATFLGKGTSERLANTVKEHEIDLVVFDGHLSPVQQRNLEKVLDCKVIDRTALILEIFGDRAQTREGVLQVELAHLTYQKSRLVRSWTHLERQRGGFGFVGGPGETQIEIDRRLISERISKLKRELETVKRTRELHRKSRKKIPYPVVALVGYTNAGKSTLFNRLTNSDVYVEDLLFATLDPTMRELELPSGRSVILSDTVGFISDLPTELIAAFRATLEEVVEADVILHVRDISHKDSEAQKEDVENVLKSLGMENTVDKGMLEALNKIDLLEEQNKIKMLQNSAKNDRKRAISALAGDGIDELLCLIDDKISQAYKLVTIQVPYHDGATIAWLYQHGEVVASEETETHVRLQVRLEGADFERVKRREGIIIDVKS